MNLAELDLRALRLVVLCAEERALGRAAIRAHMSLAGASHQLARSEQRVGKRLFHGHRRGLELTAEGAELVQQAKRLMLAVEQFQALAVMPPDR